jgi:hypothetical protein
MLIVLESADAPRARVTERGQIARRYPRST